MGKVEYAIDEAFEIAIPWTMLPPELTSAPAIAVQGLFFLYNVAPGDANADGLVDVFDLAALANSYGMVGGAAWAGGDFNLDANVDVFDLAILGSHYSTYSAPGGAEYDIFDAFTMVDRNLPLTNHGPEPATMLGVLAGLTGLAGYVHRRRRRAHRLN